MKTEPSRQYAVRRAPAASGPCQPTVASNWLRLRTARSPVFISMKQPVP